jgi:fido (protein-threonine AMPylation protein)
MSHQITPIKYAPQITPSWKDNQPLSRTISKVVRLIALLLFFGALTTVLGGEVHAVARHQIPSSCTPSPFENLVFARHPELNFKPALSPLANCSHALLSRPGIAANPHNTTQGYSLPQMDSLVIRRPLSVVHSEAVWRLHRIAAAQGGDRNFTRMVQDVQRDPLRRDGVQVTIPPDPTTLYFGLSEQQTANEMKAERFVLQWMKNSSQLTPDQIVNAMCQTHRILLESSILNFAGRYREQASMDVLSLPYGTYPQVINLIRARSTEGEAEANIETFQQMCREVNGVITYISSARTPDQRRVLKLIDAQMSSMPDAIPTDMLTLAANLQAALSCQNFNAFVLGSFLHQVMVEIHPFLDGNGHLARLLLRTAFRLRGLLPPIFPSYAEYVREVLADKRADPPYKGGFAVYVHRMWKQTMQQLGHLSSCTLPLLSPSN